MRIEVACPGGPMSNLPAKDQVRIRGIDQIEPGIPLNNITCGAFAQGADRIEVVAPELVGAFTRIDDMIRIEVISDRLRSTRYITYEFSGWQKRQQ